MSCTVVFNRETIYIYVCYRPTRFTNESLVITVCSLYVWEWSWNSNKNLKFIHCFISNVSKTKIIKIQLNFNKFKAKYFVFKITIQNLFSTTVKPKVFFKFKGNLNTGNRRKSNKIITKIKFVLYTNFLSQIITKNCSWECFNDLINACF